MKYVMILVTLMLLSGCSLDTDYQAALNNYAKDMCKGKLKKVDDVEFLRTSGYWCITETCMKYHEVGLNSIPVKYWEIEQ